MIRFATAPREPWRNGKGLTTELVSWQQSLDWPGNQSGRWRLSVATLTEPSAFSNLPGISRFFLPIGGSVTLTVNDSLRSAGDGSVVWFSGDDTVRLVDLPRPCHAVNLMTTSGHPSLITGMADEAAQSSLLMVALESRGSIGQFDVVLPDTASFDEWTGLAVALVSLG